MTNIRRTTFPSLAVALILIATPFYSRCLAQQPQQAEGQPAAQSGDPIRELNLSPEQREKIRTIREEMKEERAAINRNLRETNEALDEALDSANPNDAVVEQRLRDVAAAQAAAMRMRVLTEVRVRRVLTSDQLSTLRSLRQSARLLRRERQLENNGNRRSDAVQRRALRNQQNGLAPLLPRGSALPKPRP
ncbi:MAG: periplasmic heavy metal sensor [bacterium]